MGCPNGELLSAYFDGEVESPWSEGLADHVAGCGRCREAVQRLRALRGLLHQDAEPDCLASRERTLQRLRREQTPRRPPRWASTRATLTIPWPAAASVLAVVVVLAGFLAYFSLQPGYGQLSIRRQPTGVTEVQVAAPIKDLEYLLRSLETWSDAQEIVITLPEDSTFIMLGEPRLLREAEFTRSGQW
jgi:anti-sigma factor RsiW